MRIPGVVTDQLDRAQMILEQSLAAGHEGIVVKDATSAYAAGRRGKAWRKVKPVRTYDLVVLGAEWGHGRRQGWLSNLHLGARDPSTTGDFVMVGKCFKGLTDELLDFQTKEILAREVEREGHLREGASRARRRDRARRRPAFDALSGRPGDAVRAREALPAGQGSARKRTRSAPCRSCSAASVLTKIEIDDRGERRDRRRSTAGRRTRASKPRILVFEPGERERRSAPSVTYSVCGKSSAIDLRLLLRPHAASATRRTRAASWPLCSLPGRWGKRWGSPRAP